MNLFRTIVVVDVAQFTDPARSEHHQRTVHLRLYEILEAAFDDSGVHWKRCTSEDRGDGALIYLPPEFPPVLLTDQLPGRLLTELRRHNASHAPEARIQLRVALNAGRISEYSNGVVSQAVNHAFRVVEAAPAKQALRRLGAPLALIATDSFYREVIEQDPAAAPASYREIEVSVKETHTRAWLRLPGHDGADLTAPGEPRVSWRRERASEGPFELVEALLALPVFSDDAGRQFVVGQLRPAISGMVRYHPQPRMFMLSLVKTCEAHDGGLLELLELLRSFEGDDSPALRRLAEVIARRC
jgi:hypothetical protein